MANKDFTLSLAIKQKGGEQVKALSVDLNNLGRVEGLKKLNTELAASRDAFARAQLTANRLSAEVKASAAPTTAMTQGLKQAQQAAASLHKEFVRKLNAYQSLKAATTRAGVDVKNLAAEELRLRESTSKATKELEAQGRLNQARGLLDIRPHRAIREEIERHRQAYVLLRNTGKLTAAELYQAKSRLVTKTRELRAQTTDWSTEMGKARNGVIALAAAGYAFSRGFGSYADFAQEIAKVSTIAGATKQEMAGLQEEIIGISKVLPQTATELAAASYEMISSGVAFKDLTGVIDLSAKAAIAGITDTQTAATVGIGLINGYGESIDKLGGYYDKLFQTVNLGVTTFPELSGVIGESTPTARVAGVAFDEIAGAVALLTKNSFKTPAAVTAVTDAITGLSAPAPEAKARMEALGITWKGLIPTLEQLAEKSLTIDQMRLLIPDKQARNGVLSLTQNLGTLKDFINQIENSAGSTQAAFLKMVDTPAAKLKLFKNEISALNISLQENLAVGILPTIDGMRKLMVSVEGTDFVTKAFLAILGTAGGLFLIWKVGLGSIVNGLIGVQVRLRAATIDMTLFGSAATKAGMALRIGFAAEVVYTGVEVIRLGIEIYKSIKAAQEAEVAFMRLGAAQRKFRTKYGGDTNFTVPQAISTNKDELKKSIDEAQRSFNTFLVLKEINEKALNDADSKADKSALSALSAAYSRKMKIIFNYITKAKEALAGIKSAAPGDKTPEQLAIDAFLGGDSKADKAAKAAETKAQREAERARKAGIREGEKAKTAAENLAQAKAQSEITITRASLEQKRAILDDDYRRGTVDLAQYYDSRKAILEEAHRVEIEEARKAAEAESDPARQVALQARVVVAEKKHITDLLALQSDRNDAEKRLSEDRGRVSLTYLAAQTETALSVLNRAYDRGLVSLEDYFNRRRAILTQQYAAELAEAEKALDLETNPEARKQAQANIFSMAQAHQRAMMDLDIDESESRKRLTRDAIDLESDYKKRRLEVAYDLTGNMRTLFDIEQAELADRHRQEIQQLTDLRATEDQINEAHAVQQLERDRLFAEQTRRIWEYRIENTKAAATGLKETFTGLYELTGKKSKEFFALAKAAAIAEATMNTAQGITKAFAQGGIWGTVQAAIIAAQGAVQIATIRTQALAAGGPVLGSSPTPTADNVPIMATAGEYVLPVSTVQHYGSQVMEAMRQRILPRSMFTDFNLSGLQRRAPSFALAQGGPVPSAPGAGMGGGSINIANITDPREIDRYLASSAGQDAILNVLSSRSAKVRRIIR